MQWSCFQDVSGHTIAAKPFSIDSRPVKFSFGWTPATTHDQSWYIEHTQYQAQNLGFSRRKLHVFTGPHPPQTPFRLSLLVVILSLLRHEGVAPRLLDVLQASSLCEFEGIRSHHKPRWRSFSKSPQSGLEVHRKFSSLNHDANLIIAVSRVHVSQTFIAPLRKKAVVV
jgi:hypothetical protein